MIKVLQILPTLTRGGLETFVMNVYRAIDREAVQFDFLVSAKGGDYENEIRSLGGHIFYVPPKRLNPFRYCSSLDIFFRDHLGEYSAVHMHDSVLSSIEPLKYAKKYGIPIRLLHSHSSSVSGSKIHYLLHYMKKTVVKSWATHYLGCSDKANKWFYQYTGVLDKSMFVANGIDTSKYVFSERIRREVREELGIDAADVVLGHVGRIMWIKNHEFLLKVFADFHEKHLNSKLLIVGVGPLENDIKNKVQKMNLSDSVIFTGLRSDINRIMQSFDIFVMPSYYEGLPVVLVEAQSAGLPVLCSDTISPDSKLTENYYSMNIGLPPSEWSEKVNSILTDYERGNTKEEIVKKGFDINKTTTDLMSIYMSQL